jgi:hypothetical protein
LSFESFESKDSGDGESPDGVLKVSIGKFESFESTDSEMEEPINEDPQVSTRKFESFNSKDSRDNGTLLIRMFCEMLNRLMG